MKHTMRCIPALLLLVIGLSSNLSAYDADAKDENYVLARQILGNSFVSPEEIAKSRNKLTYTDRQLAMFHATLPAREVLEWGHENNMMLVAGPPANLSLLDIRALKVSYSYSDGDDWYAADNQTFSRNEKVETGWLMIRKDPVPHSFDKSRDAQWQMVSGVEYVPNAAEVVWALTTFEAVRGISLLRDVYVRTASRRSDNPLCVIVGNVDLRKGFAVHFSLDRIHTSYTGIISARQLNP